MQFVRFREWPVRSFWFELEDDFRSLPRVKRSEAVSPSPIQNMRHILNNSRFRVLSMQDLHRAVVKFPLMPGEKRTNKSIPSASRTSSYWLMHFLCTLDIILLFTRAGTDTLSPSWTIPSLPPGSHKKKKCWFDNRDKPDGLGPLRCSHKTSTTGLFYFSSMVPRSCSNWIEIRKGESVRFWRETMMGGSLSMEKCHENDAYVAPKRLNVTISSYGPSELS